MSAWRQTGRLVRFYPWLFALAFASWIGFYAVPLATGLLLRAFFDSLGAGKALGFGPWTLLALAAASEAGRLAVFCLANVSWMSWWVTAQTLLRRNMLEWVVAGRSGRLPGSPGEAVSRFRDDAEDILLFIDTWLDVTGQAVFAAVALIVMFQIDPLITAVIAVPIGLTTLLTQALGARLKRYRKASREATSTVTGFIGETFSAVLAVKVAGAEQAVVDRFHALSDERREAAVKDRLCMELLAATHVNTVNVATGVILLLGAGAMR
ncbi:MAG: ABC transporter transmembrane domain-containing protein, partial [Dehalococcoidia bacterium]